MFSLYENPNLDSHNSYIYLHPEVHSSQVMRLKSYIDKCIDNTTIKVEYKQKQYNNNTYGRYFPIDSSIMPAAYQPRKVRSTLFKKNEIDIDIVNAHPVILRDHYKNMIGKTAPLAFRQYITNRDEIIENTEISQVKIDEYNNED